MKTNSMKSGVIVNCLWAPVREKPNNDSHVICELAALSEISVDERKTFDAFYYIHTPSGDEGYCLKEFVVLKR